LRTDYAQAVFWSKGFAADETKEAVARVDELAGSAAKTSEHLEVYLGHWNRSFMRGEHRAARAAAESFLRQAEEGKDTGSTVTARRHLGTISLFQGALAEARSHLEQALSAVDAERESDGGRRALGFDTRVQAAAWLVLRSRVVT